MAHLTLAQRAFCWGGNTGGEVGNGTTDRQLVPTAVAGGLRFKQVHTGSLRTVGLTPEGVVYRWGAAP